MLYKYFPPERLDVLKNLKLRFSQPKVLNDPFEGSFLIHSKANEENLIEEIKKESNILWSYYKEDDKNGEILDKITKTKDEMIEHIKKGFHPKVIGCEVSMLINDCMGVLSLSRTDTSLLMWAHYAKGYTGFVIGFDESNPFFHQKYSNGKIQHPANVVYSTVRNIIEIDDLEYYEKMFFIKPIEWFYEEEVRLLRYFSTDPGPGLDENGNPLFLYDFPKDMIKEILIGHRNTNLDEIKAICQEREIEAKIYKLVIDDLTYRLVRNEV